jgi:hypothetical protein
LENGLAALKKQHTMNTPETPPAETGYRFLRAGEIIQEGDDFWFSFHKEWVEAKATVGLDVDDQSVGHYRRAV